MNARESTNEGGLYRGQREVDVENAVLRVDVGESVRRFEGPDLAQLEEHEAPLAAGNDAAARLGHRGRGLSPLVQSPKTLGDALLGEGLEQVVDDSELEGLDGMPVERGREDEHGRSAAPGHLTDEIEPRLRRRPAEELHVDENGLDTRPSEDGFTRLVDTGHGADDLAEVRALDELDQIVSRGPLVLDDERAHSRRRRRWPGQGRASTVLAGDPDKASGGSSTIERVPWSDDSSLSVAPV